MSASQYRRAMETLRSIAQLAEELRALGVQESDVVMVHASLRRIGPVAGGGDGVLDALLAAVGPSGTLMMNVGVRDDWGWVNDRPESERLALLADAEPFDALTTPAEPDNGVLAELFRVRPGTVVSDNPEGRLGALGSLAHELMADAPWDDYYGPGSPLQRLVDAGGKVLRLGADLGTVTLIHYAEYLVDLPSKIRVRRHRRVRTRLGSEVRTVECLDDSTGIVEQADGTPDYFETILLDYLAAGRASVGLIGGATSELIDAADLVDFAVRWMADHLRHLDV